MTSVENCKAHIPSEGLAAGQSNRLLPGGKVGPVLPDLLFFLREVRYFDFYVKSSNL